MQPENTTKKIAIVTGASSGIGKEFFLSLNNKEDEFIANIWCSPPQTNVSYILTNESLEFCANCVYYEPTE